MNCEHAKPLLPLWMDDSLADAEQAAVGDHVRACPTCQQEASTLRHALAQLQAMPLPVVHVEPWGVLDRAAQQHSRLARRWKRLTIAVSAVAVCLLCVLLVQPDVQVGDGAVVVRWRPAPEQPVPLPLATPDPEQTRKLELLTELVRSYAEASELRGQDRDKELETLRLRLEITQLQAERRWEDTQRDMGALYRAQFTRKENE